MIYILALLFGATALIAQTQTATSTKEVDYLQPGWSGQYKYALGYSTNFTQNATFIFDYYEDAKKSYTTYFGFTKSANSYSQTRSNNGTNTTVSNSGTKSNAVLTLAESINQSIYRGAWANVRLGWLAGLNYFQDAKYDSGSASTVNATGVTTYTSSGITKVTRVPQFFTGPVVSTSFNIRWLPMITVGMDGGMLLFTESRTKSKFTGRNGNSNAPIPVSTTTETEPGYASQMSGNGIFNLFGNFNIRYVW